MDNHNHQYGRILNRHLRGRPKYNAWQRLKSRARRLVGPLVIMALAAALFFALKLLELI